MCKTVEQENEKQLSVDEATRTITKKQSTCLVISGYFVQIKLNHVFLMTE